MGKFLRAEDEADKWLRENDPYYTDTRSNKTDIYNTYYDTPKMESRRLEMEIPMSSLSLRQRDRTDTLSTFTDDVI